MTNLNDYFSNARVSDGWLMNRSQTLSALKFFYEQGKHVFALKDAIEICMKQCEIDDDGLPLPYTDHIPDWVLAGCIGLIDDAFKAEKPIGFGRQGNSRKAFQANQVDLLRFLEIDKAKNADSKIGNKVTMPIALKDAQEALKGTISGNVTIKTLEESYYKVRKEINDPKAMHKYYPLPERFLDNYKKTP